MIFELKKIKNLSIIKTLYFNFYYLPFRSAIKMCFLVEKNVKIGCMGKRSNVVVENPNNHIKIGLNQSFALGQSTFWSVSDGASLMFRGGQHLAEVRKLLLMAR